MPSVLSTSTDASRHDADLRAYALSGDAEAFRRMVERHLPTVQQAAMRVLGPGSGWVDDVAQDVFMMLARKARQLPAETVLAAWLYRRAASRAIDIVRSETRRRKREEAAEILPSAVEDEGRMWSAIMPRLDRELLRLPGLDQKIVALRFMERCSSDEAARRLGLSSAAVRKRLERALVKLRQRLAGPIPGALTVTALAAYLSVPTAKAASASQVAAISSQCVSAVPASGASLVTFSFMTKSKLIVAGSILLVGAGAFVAGRHTSPAAVATGDAVDAASSSARGANVRDRSAATRSNRADSVEFPTTREGRLALLRVILSEGDPVSRNQALDRFISHIDQREYQSISSFLAFQKPQTALEFQAVAAAQQALFSTWAKQDPAAALAAAGASGQGKDAIVQTIANVWGMQNPDAAIAFARNRPGYPPEDDSDDPFMIGLIGSVAAQDLHKATGLLEEMPSGFTRRTALNGVISRLLAQGDAAAIQWIDGLQDEKLKKGATNRVAEEMANIDPAQAMDWIVSRMGADTEHSSIDNVFKQWTLTDKQGAKTHFDALPSGPLRSDALAAIAGSFAEGGGSVDDYRWVCERMDGVDPNRSGYVAIFERWTAKDPQAAIQRFEELSQDAATPVSEGIINRLSSAGDQEAALGFVKDHLDRISESALVQVLWKMDEATSDAILNDLAASHPGATILPGVREKLSAIRAKWR